MTQSQCEKCKRGSYRDGRCYADNLTHGKSISMVLYCWAATPCEAMPGRILKPIRRKKTNENKSHH